MPEKNAEDTDAELRQLLSEVALREKQARARSLIYIIIPVLVGGLWMWLSVQKVQRLEEQSDTLERTVKELQEQIQRLRGETKDLTQTQEGVLDFLAKVTRSQQIQLIDSDVNWDQTKKQVLALPAGQRKQAVLGAILLAWKKIPFGLTRNSLAEGIDSPRFVRSVLAQVGIEISDEPNRRLSESIMSRFSKVETPEPGDLIFYRGNIGSFVMIYLAQGKPGGQGICVGTLQPGEPVQIMDSSNITTGSHPFLGYYRVGFSS